MFVLLMHHLAEAAPAQVAVRVLDEEFTWGGISFSFQVAKPCFKTEIRAQKDKETRVHVNTVVVGLYMKQKHLPSETLNVHVEGEPREKRRDKINC